MNTISLLSFCLSAQSVRLSTQTSHFPIYCLDDDGRGVSMKNTSHHILHPGLVIVTVMRSDMTNGRGVAA